MAGSMSRPVDETALGQIFLDRRSVDNFLDRPVPEDLLRRIYELTRMPPTSANSQPMRLLFLKTPTAGQRLAPAFSDSNREKTMRVPVTAIVAYDVAFYTHLPRMFHTPGAENWFKGNDASIQENSFRNGTLQAGYFMLAARAVGLDVGPMSGFNKGKVDEEFFADGEYATWRSNFVCNLGYGDTEGLPSRDPRFDFDDVCHMI